MDCMECAICVENVSVSYYIDPIFVDISLCIPKHKMTVIIGPNGCGKSSLLKAIMCEVPFQGKIKINGVNVSKYASKSIAYSPQKREIDLDFPITVKEFVATGIYANKTCLFNMSSFDSKRVKKACHTLGIMDIADSLLKNISGGQLQKAIVARSILCNRDIIILDEPFSEIDFTSEKKIVSVLKTLCKQGKTVVIVNHDLYKADVFDWAVLMHKRVVAFGNLKEVLTPANLSKTYQADISMFDELLKQKDNKIT